MEQTADSFEFVTDEATEQRTLLDRLKAEEENLVAQLARVRGQLGAAAEQPAWMGNLPPYAWWPGYGLGKTMASLSPYRAANSNAHTLEHWRSHGNVDAFVVNCLIGILAVGGIIFLLL